MVKTIKTNVYKNKKSHNEYQPKTWQMDGKCNINVMSANRHSKTL